MTEFGLVQITRQRIRQAILHSFTEACPTCGGSGLVQSKTTTLNQIERWLRRFKTETHEKRLVLRVNPDLGASLREGTISRLKRIMLKYFVLIKLEVDSTIPIGEFRFISRSQDKDVTDQFK